MCGVAIARILGVAREIVSNDSAKRSLDAVYVSAANPYCSGAILNDATHSAPLNRETVCIAVLVEAVQATIRGHPQTSVAAAEEPVDTRVRWEGFLRQRWSHCYPVKPKQTGGDRNPDVAVACLSDHVRLMREAVLGSPDCMRILRNQPVRIKRRGSPGEEEQQKAIDRQGCTVAGPEKKRRRIPLVFHARLRCSHTEYPTGLRTARQ